MIAINASIMVGYRLFGVIGAFCGGARHGSALIDYAERDFILFMYSSAKMSM